VQVTLFTAGVPSDAFASWKTGDFFQFQPSDGSYELGEYPTLELAATAGTPVGSAIFARSYL
jgi:hypothetical protein